METPSNRYDTNLPHVPMSSVPKDIAGYELQTIHSVDIPDAPQAQDLPQFRSTEAVTLCWSNVTYTVKTKFGDKKILSNLCGIARPGEVVAIMGPSGGGKTSLLNILSNHIPADRYEGQVLANGQPAGDNMRHLAAFVPQDDSLLAFMTVEETLRYAAELQLNLTDSEIRELVEYVILRLGLSKTRNSKVGGAVVRGVSGGERRRVSIGVEMVALKPLLFLDEPTSGLDSASASFIIALLKKFAVQQGVTVLCTIHQPASRVFEKFDQLILLAYGELVYRGPVNAVSQHWEALGFPVPVGVNQADHFMDLINADFREDTVAAKEEILALAHRSMDQLQPHAVFVHTTDSQYVPILTDCHCPLNPSTDHSQLGFRTTIVKQTWVLFKRCVINAVRNLVMYWIRVLMYIALATLMGTVFLDLGYSTQAVQNRLGVHFFGVAFPCFMAVAGIPAFLEEKQVFDREYAAGTYYALSYVLAATFVSIPFIFLISICFTGVMYPLCWLHPGASYYFVYTAIVFDALFCAESLMLMMSGIFPVFVVALALAAFANGFMMVLEGFFVPYDSMPKFWIWGHFLSYQKYSFEALVINDLRGLNFNCKPPMGNSTACICPFVDELQPQCMFHGETVLKYYKYDDISITGWAFVILAMGIFYRIGFWVALMLRKKKY